MGVLSFSSLKFVNFNLKAPFKCLVDCSQSKRAVPAKAGRICAQVICADHQHSYTRWVLNQQLAIQEPPLEVRCLVSCTESHHASAKIKLRPSVVAAQIAYPVLIDAPPPEGIVCSTDYGRRTSYCKDICFVAGSKVFLEDLWSAFAPPAFPAHVCSTPCLCNRVSIEDKV